MMKHPFRQALPGDGVLCRFIKLTFLRWDRDRAEHLLARMSWIRGSGWHGL